MSQQKGLHPLMVSACRFGRLSSVFLALLFILNNFLTYVGGLPGIYGTLGAAGLFGFSAPKGDVSGIVLTMGWVQVLMALGVVVGAAVYTRSKGSLLVDALRMDKLASLIIRGGLLGRSFLLVLPMRSFHLFVLKIFTPLCLAKTLPQN